MLSFILGLIDPVTRIADKLAGAYAARQNAQTEQDRIRADEQIKALEARRDVMIAESGQGWNAAMRFALALGPCVFLLKVFIWDKVLKLGSTDDLSENLWLVVTAVIGFYFLYDITARLKR